MQLNEIRQSVADLSKAIDRASQACQNDSSINPQIKQCVTELSQKSAQVRQMIQQEQGEDQIRQSIDDLEEIGDRAKAACEKAGRVSQELKSAVLKAHDEASKLKHQLH